MALPATLFLLCSGLATEAVAISNAWIQESPPGVAVLAGYLDLENRSDRQLRVIEVQSPIAERVEIHRTRMQGDTAIMERIPELVLEPHARFSFAAGEYHLMFYGVEKPVHAGDEVALHLHLDDGQVIVSKAVVRGGQ